MKWVREILPTFFIWVVIFMINNYMRIPSLYFRLLTYVVVTGLITFISIISDSKYTSFSEIQGFEWFLLISKSLLPSLVSLKAYFDQSFSGFLNREEDNK